MNNQVNAERVLIILPNLDLGGTETVIMNYYRNINRDKLQFDFAVHGTEGYFEPEVKTLGGRIYRVPTRKQSFFGNITGMLKLYKTHKEFKAVIVCTEHSLSCIELFTAMLAGVKRRAAWSHFADYQGRSKLKRCMHFVFRPFLRLFATEYYACTKAAGKWLFGRGIKGKRFKIINDAFDMDKFAYNIETRDKIRKELGLEDKFVIGITGRLTRVKNHSFLIDVFKTLCDRERDAVLLIVGDGELKNEIEKKLDMLGLSEDVTFIGHVGNVQDYYQAMDVFTVTSLHEGLCLVALEAQASGLRCLLADTLPRETAISGLADYKSLDGGTDSWADRLLELKDYERKTEDLGGSGYDIVTEAIKFQNIFVE